MYAINSPIVIFSSIIHCPPTHQTIRTPDDTKKCMPGWKTPQNESTLNWVANHLLFCELNRSSSRPSCEKALTTRTPETDSWSRLLSSAYWFQALWDIARTNFQNRYW